MVRRARTRKMFVWSDMKPLVSVITTFRNEELLIEEFLRRVQGALATVNKYDYEIILVDDDSTDASLKILEMHAQHDNRIKVLVTSRRFGVYPCLVAGLKHASGEAVIYLETDLQDPPELIPMMLEKWEAGTDVVHTKRTKRLGENKAKMLLTAMAYKAINFVSEISIPENCGDYKLLSRRVVDHALTLIEHDPYFRGIVSWVGFNQTFLFYERQPRYSGRSKRVLLSLAPLQVFISAILSFSNKPLYAIALAGLLVPVAAFLTALYATVWTGQNFANSILLLLLIVLLCVVQISLGIHALYIVRTYAEIRKRPLFLIQKKIGFCD